LLDVVSKYGFSMLRRRKDKQRAVFDHSSPWVNELGKNLEEADMIENIYKGDRVRISCPHLPEQKFLLDRTFKVIHVSPSGIWVDGPPSNTFFWFSEVTKVTDPKGLTPEQLRKKLNKIRKSLIDGGDIDHSIELLNKLIDRS
jgi:hypothetical protein